MNYKILIISGVFYPEKSPRSYRATELAKEFSRQGHIVTVCFPTEGYDYSSFESENNLRIKNLGSLKLKQFDIKGGTLKRLIRRLIKRGLQVLLEWPDIQLKFMVTKFLRRESGYDILISIAVPHPINWGVAKAWDRKKKIARRWIADCGDSYMLARLDTFRKPFYFKYFEKSFCRKCDLISIPFDQLSTQFYPEFHHKIVTIPQGFNLDEISRYNGPVHNEKTTFLFAGSIIPKIRDLRLFLSYLITWEEDFLFIVYTKQREWFKEYRDILQDRIDIRDYVDRQTLIYEMSKVDFLINVDTLYDSDSNTEAIPSKLIDYALSGRPILSLNSNHLDNEKVKAFLSGDYTGARVIDVSRYDIKTVANQFIQAGTMA